MSLVLSILCYKYLANLDSAEYQAIRPERMPGAAFHHSLMHDQPFTSAFRVKFLVQHNKLTIEL